MIPSDVSLLNTPHDNVSHDSAKQYRDLQPSRLAPHVAKPDTSSSADSELLINAVTAASCASVSSAPSPKAM
jgi:hypothetical protein